MQTEIYNQKHITNDKIEAESNVVSSKKDLHGSILEQKSEYKNVEIKKIPLKCEHCDYKCKKVTTMKKHKKLSMLNKYLLASM